MIVQRLRRRTDYTGTETWLSLTAGGDAARLESVYELGVRALVTNRELPELLRFKGATESASSKTGQQLFEQSPNATRDQAEAR